MTDDEDQKRGLVVGPAEELVQEFHRARRVREGRQAREMQRGDQQASSMRTWRLSVAQ